VRENIYVLVQDIQHSNYFSSPKDVIN